MLQSENCISSLFVLHLNWAFSNLMQMKDDPQTETVFGFLMCTHTHTHTYIYRERDIYIASISRISVTHPSPRGESHWRHAASSTRTNWEHLPWPSSVMLLFPSTFTPSFWICFAAHFLSENSQYCERPKNYMHSVHIVMKPPLKYETPHP